jgi:hypothetical protein
MGPRVEREVHLCARAARVPNKRDHLELGSRERGVRVRPKFHRPKVCSGHRAYAGQPARHRAIFEFPLQLRLKRTVTYSSSDHVIHLVLLP